MPNAEITDSTLMPFGKYKDKKKMVDVPAVYLLWLYNDSCSHEGVRQYIERNLDVLRKEAARIKR